MSAEKIIDAEVHLLHPAAHDADFAQGLDEPVRRAVHDHPEFHLVKDLMSREALKQSMQSAGISHSVIMGMSWRDAGILRDNNEYIASTVREDPELFRACYIPHLGDMKQCLTEIETLDDELFLGVKLLPRWQGRRIDDPALEPLFEAVSSRGLFLMVHTDHLIHPDDGDTAFRLLQVLKKFPKLKLLAPHLGGLLCLYGLLPEVAEQLRNVTFITSVSKTMQMVRFAAEVCPDNIIFGTDFPFNHCHNQRQPLAEMREMELPNEVRSSILSARACELFGF